ncbi:MAG: hypothetical protein Q3M30_20090 [Candidatus Electrothrix sp. Rat3]|nr:hypothetical protein [Candidatus Electrothrix rattekaaiensis]
MREWEDPIVKETRELRDNYTSRFKGDMKAMYQDILRRQQAHKERLTTLPSRKPKHRNSST